MTVSNVASTYGSYQSTKKADTKAEAKEEKAVEAGAVYEKSEEKEAKKPATYNVNKMTEEQRKQIVEQLKADNESRMKQLTDIVSQMMTGQATTFAKTEDGMWKFLASGEFTVDAATKAQAQKDIAEDGYYGIKQTSQRMFDFACALAGDDVDKMKKMEAAIDKGYQMALKTWGRELPQICQDTMKATHDLFSDYYASKEVE